MLTGERGVGKSSCCHHMAELASARGWDVAGVLSPALFQEGRKIGIQVADLRSGETRALARYRRSAEPGASCYDFDPASLDWADALVAGAPPCDLLMVDELGPLEMEQGKGLVSALDVLRKGDFRLAVVVVRPSLLDLFQARLGFPCAVRRVRGLPPGAHNRRAVPVEWFEEYLRG